jgi:hypothetical protein
MIQFKILNTRCDPADFNFIFHIWNILYEENPSIFIVIYSQFSVKRVLFNARLLAALIASKFWEKICSVETETTLHTSPKSFAILS